MTLTEKKLKESEERFKTLFKSSPIPTYAWQKVADTFELIDYNNAAEDITQGNVKMYLGSKASEMYRDRPGILENLRRCLKEKKNITHETKYKMQSSKDEKDLIVKYVYVPPDLVLVHTEDITERKNAQQELKVSEEKYRKLFSNAPFAIVLFNIEGTILDCNDATKLITGYSKEELIGKNYRSFNFYIDTNSANIEERQSQTYSGKTPKAREILLYRKDGSQFWARSQIEFIHMKDRNYIQAIIHDITEKKKAEQKLKESEEKFRNIAEQSLMGINVIQDGVFKYLNARTAEVNGYPLDELKNWNPNEFAKIIYPDDRKFVMEQARKKQAGDPDIVNQYSFRIIRKDGEIRWLEIFSKTINFEGRPADLVMTVDTTDKKEAELNLKESEKKFRTLFEAIPDSYFLLSEDSTVIEYRGKLQELYAKPEEFIGKKIVDVLPSYLRDQTMSTIKQTIKTKQPHNFEYELLIQNKMHYYEARYFYLSKNRVSCFIRDITDKKKVEKDISDLAKFPSENPNPVLRVNKEKIIYTNQAGKDLFNLTEGDKIPALLEAKIIKALDESITKNFEVEVDHAIYSFNIAPIQQEQYANIYGQDITERKKSEIALNTEKKFTEDILNSSIDTVFVFDPETGKTYRWNKAFSEVTGYTDEEISFMSAPDSYYDEHDLKLASDAAKEALTEGKTTIEMSLITKDGKRIPYEYTGTRFKNVEGKLLIVSVGRDITERKEIEQKLKESEKKYHEAYDRANFYKDLFAHDINNILQVISSSAELISLQLDDSEKSKDIESIAKIIRKHVQKGAKLVNNVRTLTELDNGDQIIEPIEVISVLKNSIKFLQSAYSEKNIEIKIDTFANIINIQANELLQQIFDNLLINAIKYNENSNVDIQIKITKEQSETQNLIKMEFLDNGIGIRDDKKKILFKEGFRTLKGSKGMGLGLSLVYKIINNYNGKIWVEDKVKGDYTKGSNFVLLLLE